MTKIETAKLFKLLKALFPSLRNTRAEDVDDMVNAYFLVLRKWSYGEVRDAVLKLAERQRLFPSTSEIVDLLPKRSDEQLDDYTKIAVRNLLGCSVEKCASCEGNESCKLR